MEQIRKALSRAQTAFEKLNHRTDLINDEVSPGREMYEIDRALEELNQMDEPATRLKHTIQRLDELLSEINQKAKGECSEYKAEYLGLELPKKMETIITEAEEETCNLQPEKPTPNRL